MSEVRIIRDVVHSDIVFENKYFELIDTKEFQRLNRIKQLSCEYLVFPGATHTRLIHSIGCYYVMEKLIDHFSAVLFKLGCQVQERERELALCAALIHDIGHGPFSHSFENIFHGKSHEQWAVDIISDQNTEIHQVILKNFGADFLHQLTDIISKEYAGQSGEGILSVISTLVSSQVDADRMDYLLRDSYFTAVSNGNYDLNRLIRSLGIEKSDKGSFTVFINEKFMATLEEYILARYYMHKEVYQHPVKKQMEGILKKIFCRAKQLLSAGKLIYCDEILRKLMMEQELGVNEYLTIDDNTFIYHISLWQQSDDLILSYLCHAFLDRNKFTKYTFDINDDEVVKEIQQSINKVLETGNQYPIKDFNKEYFYIEEDMDLSIYVNTKENIWIKSKDGTLSDLSDRSAIINRHSIKNQSDSKKRIYISSELFEMIYRTGQEMCI